MPYDNNVMTVEKIAEFPIVKFFTYKDTYNDLPLGEYAIVDILSEDNLSDNEYSSNSREDWEAVSQIAPDSTVENEEFIYPAWAIRVFPENESAKYYADATIPDDVNINSDIGYSAWLLLEFLDVDSSSVTGDIALSVDRDSMMVNAYSLSVESIDNYLYMFISGQGTDGGFGDYAPAIFGSPYTLNNDILFTTDVEKAKRIVEKLNDMAAESFYSVGFHDQYDGNFPMEYDVSSVPGALPPFEEPSEEFIIQTISDMDRNLWSEQ